MGDSSLFLDRLYDKTFGGLTKALDLTWKRNEALASNVANAETPQYRAVDLHFAGELERAFERSATGNVARTDARHLTSVANSEAHLTPDLSGATRPDGNNVDIDLQMGRLRQNSTDYSIAAQLIRKKMQLVKDAIRYGMS